MKDYLPEPTQEEIEAMQRQIESDEQQYRDSQSIVDIIYKSFEKSERERKPQEKITFAPSYLSKCGRAIYYDKKAETPSNPPELPAKLKMYWGDILHKDIQERLQKAGVLESFEEFRTIEHEGLTFNYFYDGIVKVQGERAILEIKTVYASGYSSIEERPKDDHVLQCLSYMIFEKIDKGIILYAGRDNGFLKQHKIAYDFEGNVLINGKNLYGYAELWHDKIMKMKRLKELIESGGIPDRDFQIRLKNKGGQISHDFQHNSEKIKSDWQCTYCSHKDTCWKDVYAQIGKYKFYINNKFE